MHKPDHIRQAFQEYLDSGTPATDFTVNHDGEKHNLDWLLSQLWNCTDVLPAKYCDRLDILKGSTYAQAVRRKEKKYVYKSTLSKVYGLTPSMIGELGEPDEYCDNPHYRSILLANLYLIERVEAWIEANQERVDKARISRAKRSAAMKTVHDKKRAERWEKAQEWVAALSILFQPLPSTLLADARKRYTFADHVDLSKVKGLRAYVRHRLTNYETLLQELYRQEFSNDVYPLFRERVDKLTMAALVEWQSHLPESIQTSKEDKHG